MSALKKGRRLNRGSDIGKTVKHGRRIEQGGYVVHISGSDKDNSRSTVIVAKSVDKRAVVRNRIRRQISEVLRVVLPKLKNPKDIVVQVKPEALKTDPKDMKRILENILK